jgi:hypothetical protein
MPPRDVTVNIRLSLSSLSTLTRSPCRLHQEDRPPATTPRSGVGDDKI